LGGHTVVGKQYLPGQGNSSVAGRYREGNLPVGV